MLDFLNTITFIEVKGWIFKIYHIVLFRENFINEKHKGQYRISPPLCPTLDQKIKVQNQKFLHI